jgi:arsenite-transporting ATPase
VGGLLVNRILTTPDDGDRYAEQQEILAKFQTLSPEKPIFTVPQELKEPVGATALDQLVTQIAPLSVVAPSPLATICWPAKVSSNFDDFITAERQLLLVGGKGGVGKTTVAAAIAWGMAERHPDRKVRVISIDPAHSLGDALGQPLGHQPTALSNNLTGQEIDANQVLDQFRGEYLWELADMMSGDSAESDRTLSIAYGPEAWRRIAAQALPGIDEMLSLITVIDLLERQEQDLIILDTAPTGHLLRFLEMPTALGDWLAWIFKLWIKYQAVLGRTEFMSRLRSLRQRVMQAQKRLQDPQYTEFILVLQAQSAIVAEAQRLAQSLEAMNVPQRYVVHNRFELEHELDANLFPQRTIIHLPVLPRSIAPLARITGAADLLF